MIRTYLAPTETFINYQISYLQAYKPIVLCHKRKNGYGLFSKDVFATTELLVGPSKIFAKQAYNLFRHLTNKECEVLIDVIEQHNVRLLHFHYAVDARYFLALKRRLKLPAIVSCYGYDVSYFPTLYFGYGKRYLAPIFEEMDKFLVMSEDMKKDLIALDCPAKKISVHYYGIEAEKFAYPDRKYEDREIINILICGTLEVKKGQHLVLEALKKLELDRSLKTKFKLTIVGDGPMKSRLMQMVKSFGWQNQVIFTGYIPYHDKRLIDEYHNADIFVLPSITVKGDKEGIPGTIVEAMAAGLPVISTYHAGIPAVIENHKEGILVKEKDVDALADALRISIANKKLREKLGRAAAARAIEEFDAKNRIRELEKIYQSLL